MASKFTAFNDRGASEPRTGHDFEDIVYVPDNRTDIVELLTQSPEDVKLYLKEQLENILDNIKQIVDELKPIATVDRKIKRMKSTMP